MDTFEVSGFTFGFDTAHDSDMCEPWREHDGHGVVSDWMNANGKRAGNRILYSDRGSYRFYDVQESTRIAWRDGWGLCADEVAKLSARLGRDATRGDIVAAAVAADFERLRAWCNDEWSWVTLRVVLLDVDGDETGADEYLGGIESDAGEYIEECAHDLAAQIIDSHKLKRRKFLQDGAARVRIKD